MSLFFYGYRYVFIYLFRPFVCVQLFLQVFSICFTTTSILFHCLSFFFSVQVSLGKLFLVPGIYIFLLAVFSSMRRSILHAWPPRLCVSCVQIYIKRPAAFLFRYRCTYSPPFLKKKNCSVSFFLFDVCSFLYFNSLCINIF